ncbi:MAG: hypothetical protein GWP19_13755, partial [Planctomycetia bacterium]|nr:hypothetical protein [Planctomycetia bacterium]
MTSFQLITLILSAVTLFYYAWYGVQIYRNTTRAEEYILVARHLSRKDYTQTFVATSTSLATALTFFFAFGAQFGLALIIAPIMFSLGVILFRKITSIMADDKFFENGTTLHQYILSKYDSSFVKNIATAISLLGYLGIFVIELYVGVKIFTIFSPDPGWQAFIAVILLLLVFLYVYLGGYPAVIKTDSLQLKLITVGVGLLLLTFIVSISSRGLWGEVLSMQYMNPLPNALPWFFVVVMIVGNVPFQMLKMSNWHRAAASGDYGRAKSALSGGWKFTFLIWFVATICGILGGVIAKNAGIEGFDINKAFSLLSNEIGNGTIFQIATQYIVYPLLFCGAIAALISTADSAFIPILATYVFDMRYQGQDIDSSDEFSSEVLASTRKVVILFMMAGVLLYVLLTYVLNLQFIHLLFIFFNQQLVLFPVVWFALMNSKEECSSYSSSAIISMIVAGIATWALALYGGANQRDDLVMLSSVVGFVGSILVFYLIKPSAMMRLSMW